MIIHTCIMIIICFKEIYSWNSAFASNFFYIPLSSHSNKGIKSLKKRFINKNDLTDIPSTTSGDLMETTTLPNTVNTTETFQKNLSITETEEIVLTPSTTIEKPIEINLTTITSTTEVSTLEINENITNSTIITNITSQNTPTNSTETVITLETGGLHSIHYILIALSVIALLCLIAYVSKCLFLNYNILITSENI